MHFTRTISSIAASNKKSRKTASSGGGSAPSFITAPAIIGTPQVGQIVSFSTGQPAGSPSPTLTQQWLLDGVAIAGATNLTYTPVAGDAGAGRLSVRQTATNSSGAASSTSAAANVNVAPAITAGPVILGIPTVGTPVAYTQSTATGFPVPTRTRQWLRNGVAISGATNLTYTPVDADIGTAILSVRETLTNSLGSDNATSTAVNVAGFAPSFTQAPTIAAGAVVGTAKSYTAGTVAGAPAPSVTRQWLLNGVAISGATGTTYTPVSGDAGGSLSVRETATNSYGAVSSTTSSVTVTASGSAPVFTSAPILSGTATVGTAKSYSAGVVAGTAPITVTRQWLLDGVAISGATNATYTPVSGDVGRSLSIRETATNSFGTASSTSGTLTVAAIDDNQPTLYRYLRVGAAPGGNGQTWATAWNSLSAASLSAGQTLWMAGGSYTNGGMNSGGTSGNPVTYKAATVASHGMNSGFTASTMAVDGGAGPVTFTNGVVVGASHITIDGQVRSSLTSGHGIRCMAGPASSGDNAKIYAAGALKNNLTIRYVQIGEVASPNNLDKDGLQGNGNNLLVEYCYFHSNNIKPDGFGGEWHGDGIQWFSGSNLVIRYNMFRSNGQHITMCWVETDPSTIADVWIYRNVFDNIPTGATGHPDYALNAGGSDASGTPQAFISNVNFVNNTVFIEPAAGTNMIVLYPNGQRGQINWKNNAHYFTQCNEIGPCNNSNNAYDNGGTGACTNIPTETGRVVAADLGFENAAAGDYRLKSTSVLRPQNGGTGVNLGLPAVDIVGNPAGATPCIGAFEFV